MEQGKLVSACKEAMEKRLKAFESDLSRVRTGRASITLLDGIKVDYYGTPSLLNQVATVTTPDSRSIVVAPFERTLIQEIEKSIMKADIGLQPTNDGNVVRIPIPALTEDRRKDIVKGLKKIGEDAKVSVRGIRKDSNNQIKSLLKTKDIGEDDSKKFQAEIQKVTDDFIKVLDKKLVDKEKEIMTV